MRLIAGYIGLMGSNMFLEVEKVFADEKQSCCLVKFYAKLLLLNYEKYVRNFVHLG